MAGDIATYARETPPASERAVRRAAVEVPDLRVFAYSARLFQPFIRLLHRTSLIPEEWTAAIRGMDPEERLPAATAHQLLDGVVSLGVDPSFGLMAAREWNSGDGGALDYAVTSASTIREAVEAAGRYMGLVNEVASIHLAVSGGVAVIHVENALPMTRVGLDFQLGSLYRLFRCVWASGCRPSLRVLIQYAEPEDVREHLTTFEGAPLVFGSSHPGFTFDAALLDKRLTSADFRLHDTIRLHAEQMLQELPRSKSLTSWIESAIAAELPKGAPTVNRIASRLRMSTRTLERRLEREGTTFSNLLEDLRKRLAVRYVTNQAIPLGEIAFLLGFSHTTGFHRAFKRWTGETPLAYRKAHSGTARGPSVD